MKDRSVEYPNRYRMTLVPGTTDIYEMTPVPGEVYEEGTLMSKGNMMDDNTENVIWGDAADRTVNQALLKLALSVYAGEGMVVNVTVQNDAGEPFEGAIIAGLFDSSANVLVTDAEGKATGYTVSTSATLSVTGFFDLEDAVVTVTGDRGSTQDVTITMKRRNFLSITSTQAKMFSPFCKRVDVTAVGGGGGGGTSTHASSGIYTGGGGGGGGYVTVKEDVSFDPLANYTATIGAGGAKESAGGTSSFLGVSASGGQGADGLYGGAGNGKGGNGGGLDWNNNYGDGEAGSAGTVLGYISFTDTALFGGGGGGGRYTDSEVNSGGSPYGGSGGTVHDSNEVYTNPTNGSPGGGGGGGAGVGKETWTTGTATGGRGVVNIRMWFEEDLAA